MGWTTIPAQSLTPQSFTNTNGGTDLWGSSGNSNSNLTTQPFSNFNQALQQEEAPSVKTSPPPPGNSNGGVGGFIGNAFSGLGTIVHNATNAIEGVQPQVISPLPQNEPLTTPTVLPGGLKIDFTTPTDNADAKLNSNNSKSNLGTSIENLVISLLTGTDQTAKDVKQFIIEDGQDWARAPSQILQQIQGKKITPNPDMSASAQRGADIVGGAMMSGNVEEGALSGNLGYLAKQGFTKATKNVVESGAAPQTFFFSPSQVEQVVIGNNQGFAKDILSKTNMSSSEWKAAVKSGAKVEIPADKIITMTDKPYWAKLKNLIGKAPAKTSFLQKGGTLTVSDHIAGLLPDGEYKPETVRKTILNTPLSQTPEAKTVIDASIKATQQGKNLVISQSEGIAKLENAIQNYVKDEGIYYSPIGEPQTTPALSELTNLSTNPDVVKFTQDQVSKLPTNPDGTITLYRGATPTHYNGDRLISASFDKDQAANFAQGENKTIQTFTVNPSDIKIFVGGGEKEVLVPGSALTEKVPTTKPGFTTQEARTSQDAMSKTLEDVRHSATSQEDQIGKVKKAVFDHIQKAKGNRNVLAGIRTALNKEMMGFAGKSGNYKGDYAMFQTLKNDSSIGSYISSLEDHVNMLDNLLFSTNSQTAHILEDFKKEAEAIPSGKEKTELEHFLTDLESTDPMTGEARYALDLLTNTETFDDFVKAVQHLEKELDSTFTQLHNDMISGKVTAAEYESYRKEYRQPLQYSAEQERSISSQTSNESAKTNGINPNAQKSIAQPQSSPGSELNTQANGSELTGNGSSNRESSLNETNRTPGVRQAVTSENEKRSFNSKLGYESRGTSPLGAFEKVPESKSESTNFKLHKEIEGLIRKYAQSIGEGYLPRNAAGVYYTGTKNIRVSGMNDLAVASHEITHFLDKKYKISSQIMEVSGESKNGNPIYSAKSQPLRKEMTTLYTKYYGGNPKDSLQKRTVEGFATLLQKYIEMPSTITNEFPNLVKTFLQPEGKYYHPIMGEIINDLRGIVSRYQGLSALDKIGASVTSEKSEIVKQSYFNLKDRLRTEFLDSVFHFEEMSNRAGKGRTLGDVSLWLRYAKNDSYIFGNNLLQNKGYYAYRDGAFKKVNDQNWHSLIDTLQKEKQLDSFAYYLVARDQYFHWQRLDQLQKDYESYKPVIDFALKAHVDLNNFEAMRPLVQEMGIPQDAFKAFIKTALEKQKAFREQEQYLHNNAFTREEAEQAYLENKERWPKEEALFDTLKGESLKFLNHSDVGLLSPENFNELSSRQGHAPMQRQIYDELLGNAERPAQFQVGGTKVSSLIRRQGGTQTIVNPLYNALLNEKEILGKGLKQIVYNKFADIALENKFPDIFQPQTLKTAKESNGTIYFPQEKDPNFIMARVNYKRVPILTDKFTKNAIDDLLTYRNAQWFIKILQSANRFFTHGTTGFYIPFALANNIRHNIDGFAQSQNNFIPIYSQVEKLTKILANRDSKEAQLALEYITLGGLRQTLMGWQDKSPEEQLRIITGEKAGLEKYIDFLDKGMNLLAIPAKYSEFATRMSEFINSSLHGNPQIVALEDAGRIDAPFHHIGRWGGNGGEMLVRSIPFFNADLQYMDMAIRSIENPKTRSRYFFVAMLVTASVIASGQLLAQFGSKEQKQEYNDLQPNDLARYLWLPSQDGKSLLKFPMPQQMTVVSTLINMFLNQTMNDAHYSALDFIQGEGVILPNPLNVTDFGRFLTTYIPQLVKPAFEASANIKDYPKFMPMVPQGLQKLPPSQQFNKSTSPVAKKLGEMFNLSPIKIDYLLNGYFGRASGYLTGKPSVLNPAQEVVSGDYFSSGRMVQNFYDAKQTNDQNYTALKAKTLSVSYKDRVEIVKDYHIDRAIGKLLTDYRKVDLTKTPEKGASLRNRIVTMISNRMHYEHH